MQRASIPADITVIASANVIKRGFSLQNKWVLLDELDSVLPAM
jgi:hypothetical protein